MSKNRDKRAIVALDQTISYLKMVREDLDLAYQVQWTRPTSQSDPADPGIRSRGGHLDPTGDTAVNEARLDLRHQVRSTEKAVEQLAPVAFRMSSQLRARLRAYGMED